MGNLSEDEIKQMQAERQSFFEATKEIRQQLYQKGLELRSELAKKDPDAAKAAGIQDEISELKGQMGRMRLDHILKLKKINPWWIKFWLIKKVVGSGPPTSPKTLSKEI